LYKSFSIVAGIVCVLGFGRTTVVQAQLLQSTYDAGSGEFPYDGCAGWSPTTNPSTMAMLDNGELVLATTTQAENLSYTQASPAVGTPAQLVISFRMRLVSGTSDHNSRAPAIVGFVTSDEYRQALLLIEDGAIALTSAPNTRGPDVAVATSDALHDYRIEVDTSTGDIDVYHDAALVLEGVTYTDPNHRAPIVYWGEISIRAFGESRWTFFQHNALAMGPNNLVCGDPVGETSQVADDVGGLVTASDALLALQASVGSACCEACACDVNDNGDVTATDALLILRSAIGTGLPLVCPVCD
jgi:hypothetical protein